MHDVINPESWRGHVTMDSDQRGRFHDAPNMLMNQSVELMLRCLMGVESVNGIVVANTDRRPATPGMKTLPGGILTLQAESDIGRDAQGNRTLATWRGVWTPEETQTYDMLGLLTRNRFLFAATSFEPVTIQAGEQIAINWTILLRG